MFNGTYYQELSDEYIEHWGGDNYLLKRRTITIITHVSSALSFVGSVYILYDILGRGRVKRNRMLSIPFNQLLVGISLSDSITSFALFFATWAFPSDGIDANFFSGSSGNTTTCTIQGILVAAGFAASNTFIIAVAVLSLILTKYRVISSKMRKIHRFFLLAAPVMSLSFGTLFLVDDTVVPLGITCFPGGVYPYFCRYSEHSRRKQCILREPKVPIAQKLYILYYSISFLVLSCCMICVIIEAKKRNLKSSRWSHLHDLTSRRPAQRIVNRAFLHIMASATIYLPVILTVVMGKPYNWFSGIFMSVLYPAHGFINALIYSRKYAVLMRYLKVNVIGRRRKLARDSAQCKKASIKL